MPRIAAATHRRPQTVRFLRELMRTPSLPGAEGELAQQVMREMERLGFAEVRTDEVGNVLGVVRGDGAAPPVLFNTHLDHVDVGDPGRWPHPPFGGEVHDGRVWGRGAVDIKGPLAAQVHGVARLIGGPPPPGDVIVSAVVQEEVGGLGARHLAAAGVPSLVVVGEPSRNTVRRGHRGRLELEVRIEGRSVHASVPAAGRNPLYPLGRFLSRLHELEMPVEADLGASTVAPTLLVTDQTSANVTPGEVRLTLDWRNVPGQTDEEAAAMVRRLLEVEPPARAEVSIPLYERRSYTGVERRLPASNPAYLLAADHPAIRVAAELAGSVLGTDCAVDVWRFATDGGHFAAAGATPVGFGPGDERLAHTRDEHIEIDELEAAVGVYERFARELAARVASAPRP